MGGNEKKKSRTQSNRWFLSYYLPMMLFTRIRGSFKERWLLGSSETSSSLQGQGNKQCKEKFQIISFYYAHYYASLINSTTVLVTFWSHFTGKKFVWIAKSNRQLQEDQIMPTLHSVGASSQIHVEFIRLEYPHSKQFRRTNVTSHLTSTQKDVSILPEFPFSSSYNRLRERGLLSITSWLAPLLCLIQHNVAGKHPHLRSSCLLSWLAAVTALRDSWDIWREWWELLV